MPAIRGAPLASDYAPAPPGLGAAFRMSPLVLLFLAIFNSILGLSVLFPILGMLGRELGLGELQVGMLTTGYALAQLLAGPYWGRKSETHGRKPILLRGILGFALTFLAFAIVAHLGRAGRIEGHALFALLLATRVLGGLWSSATLPTAQAYVADVTERADRTAGMSVVGAAFGLGIVFGPAIGGLLAPFGLLVPVYLSSAIGFVNAFFVWRTLPEPQRSQRPLEAPGLTRIASKFPALLAVAFTATLASVAMEQTVPFYFQDRLGLTTTGAARSVAVALVVYGIVAVIVQGGFVRRTRWPPIRLVRVGIPLAALGLGALVFARTEPLLIAAMALQGLGQGLTLPGVAAAISLRAGDDEQGGAAGLTSSSQALGRTVGPVLGTGLYEVRPEYPYVFGATLLVLVLLVAWFVSACPRTAPASPRA